MPFVLRTDYNGFFGKDVDWFNTNVMAKKATKWLPEGPAYEVGGVIAANADGDGKDECTKKSFHFHTTIAAHVSGVHTCGIEADDGAMLYTAGKEIVNNDGGHAPRWRKGSVFLQEGQKQALDMYYGNDQYTRDPDGEVGGPADERADGELAADHGVGALAPGWGG